MPRLSRRAFLGGSAAALGGLVVADHLRFFEPADSELVSSERSSRARRSSTGPATPTTATARAGTSCTSSTGG